MLTIAGRELSAIFNTAIGWMVMAGFLLITGVFWASAMDFYAMQSQDLVSNPYAGATMNLTDHLLSPFFGNTAVILLMLSPALSMRLFSEELKQRSMELLFTSPVTTLEIVLGKFLGAVGFVALMLVGTLYVPFTATTWASPDMGALIGGYLCLLLVSSSVLAVGMFFSATTKNQIVALVLGFSAALTLWILSWVSQDPDSIFAQLSLINHIEGFLRGAVELSDIVYFVSFIGFCLLATHQRVESWRWS